MQWQRNGLTARALMSALSCITAAILAGCAGTPMQQAIIGDPEPLANLIYSGQIDPNERILGFKHQITPLCATVNWQKHAAAVAKLLRDGADINKPCYQSGEVGSEDYRPLDVLIRSATFSGTQTSPYVTGTTYSPDRYRFFMKRIDQFIALGAQSYRGPLTLSQVEAIVSDGTVEGNKYVEEQRQRVAQDKRDSIFSAENLGLVVTVAGGVVNNYANARSTETVAARVPIAAAQLSSPRPAAQPSAAQVSEIVQSRPSVASAPVDRAERVKSPVGFPKTLARSWTASGLSKTSADGWCARDSQKIRDGFPTSSSVLLSMGSCTCKIDSNAPANSGPGLEKEYFCGFDYVVRQDRPEPGAR